MRRRAAHDGRRFKAVEVEPERSVGLRADHPALAEGRTVFPSTVVNALDSPRILVSGSNSPKLGKVITKGPWAGMPIYQVTLEERATCPRSCPVWADCYGNAMHMARRHDARDPDFLVALWAEVVSLYRETMNQRTPPPGLAIRLHVLGDFPSAQYVRLWADLLDKLPHLHVFGFTARREDADDDASRATARSIRILTDAAWDRFAIRSSRDTPGPQAAVVIDQDTPGVITCPAQTDKTASCSSCGLCWAPAARGLTIGFLRHGIKRKGQQASPRPRGGATRASLNLDGERWSLSFPPGRPPRLPEVGSDKWWEAHGL